MAEVETGTSAQANGQAPTEAGGEKVNFKLVFNKVQYDVTLSLNDTVGTMKKKFQEMTGVPAMMQKVMYKGMLKEDGKTLREVQMKDGAKIMLVGSSLQDVLSTIGHPGSEASQATSTVAEKKTSLSDDAVHKKVLDKGMPDDIMEGHRGKKEPWPPGGIRGMHTRGGQKVRLSWKPEMDQLWIGTKERTEKIPVASVHGVESEPIKGHDNYHIMAIKLGTTDASKFWVYWVPAQYVETIKDTLLGPWQTPN
eukprot:comp6364_c0_seq1/m.2157 comp6364_c0_seq1/g.2157  ORF comp6364_c0_seq1/g.2157 comp6364_c0_seq1/m.2157 type:complete len:252 (-) comp6364_c0_seq1:19-774(-)